MKAYNQSLELTERARTIDEWSGRVSRLRAAGAHDTHELDRLCEELGVAEAELRTQHDELVTARIAAELERQQYQQLFDHAPVPYVITDAVGTIQAPNAAAVSLFGVQGQRLVGKPLQVFVDGAARADFRREITRIVESGEASGTLRARFVSRGNASHDTLCVIGVVRDRSLGPTDLRWLIVPETVAFREERERLLRESEEARIAAEAANRAKTELLATVSHELRTPLTAIGGYSELLGLGLRGPLTPEQASDVERIHRAQQHMVTLLDDLLLYFRLGLGGLSATVTTATVTDVLSGLSAFIAPQANQRRVTLSIESPASGTRVMADVDRARQILINLLMNAVKFSPPDGSIDVRMVDRDAFIDVEVIDHGPGIPAERLEVVFEPFVQLESGPASRGGFGLGLAISRKLAQLMGGALRARSAPGEGACFVLSLRKAP